MYRPEVSEERKPEQQMCHVFVSGVVQRCCYLIAQRNCPASTPNTFSGFVSKPQ